jgi:hypothetical protein
MKHAAYGRARTLPWPATLTVMWRFLLHAYEPIRIFVNTGKQLQWLWSEYAPHFNNRSPRDLYTPGLQFKWPSELRTWCRNLFSVSDGISGDDFLMFNIFASLHNSWGWQGRTPPGLHFSRCPLETALQWNKGQHVTSQLWSTLDCRSI